MKDMDYEDMRDDFQHFLQINAWTLTKVGQGENNRIIAIHAAMKGKEKGYQKTKEKIYAYMSKHAGEAYPEFLMNYINSHRVEVIRTEDLQQLAITHASIFAELYINQ